MMTEQTWPTHPTGLIIYSVPTYRAMHSYYVGAMLGESNDDVRDWLQSLTGHQIGFERFLLAILETGTIRVLYRFMDDDNRADGDCLLWLQGRLPDGNWRSFALCDSWDVGIDPIDIWRQERVIAHQAVAALMPIASEQEGTA